MADKPRTNIDGYHLVMLTIKGQNGEKRSPQTWLADQLGTTRQAIHQWADNDGIPDKHVDDVAELTGLSVLQVRPESVTAAIPGSMFDQIAAQAVARKTTFSARLIAIIKAGLNINP